MPDALQKYPAEGGPGGDATRLVLLDQLDRDLFRSRFSEYERSDHLFGGQVMAQALAAATATIEGASAHSIHGYFLRAGSASQRVIFHVERTRDGRSFATRRVIAVQNSVPIFHMECSFHNGEPGVAHHEPIPLDLPPPEASPTLSEAAQLMGDRLDPDVARVLGYPRLIEGRLLDPEQLVRADHPARRRLWVRVPSAANSTDPGVQQQMLAFLSDYWLAGVALVPHPIRMSGPKLFMASLDHALWLHEPHRADEWLLYDCDSPWAGKGRGLARGSLYARDGRLVASVAQEALIRLR